MKVKDAIKDYLVEVEIKRFTKQTRHSYQQKLMQFEKYLKEELDITYMDDITPAVVKQYTQHMTRKGMKGISINTYLKVVKTFLQYCYDEGFGGFNAKRGGIKWVKQEKTIIRTFSVQDVRAMLSNCNGIDYLSVRDKAIITFLVETGIRGFELCDIKKEDIHEDYIIIRGKGRKTRSVPLTPMMKKEILRYERTKEDYFELKPHEDYYFLSKNGRVLDTHQITRIIKRRGKDIKGVRVSVHTMRHFFTQQSLKNGVSLYSLSRLLGHENVGITQIYLNSLQDADIVKMNKSNSVLMNMDF